MQSSTHPYLMGWHEHSDTEKREPNRHRFANERSSAPRRDHHASSEADRNGLWWACISGTQG